MLQLEIVGSYKVTSNLLCPKIIQIANDGGIPTSMGSRVMPEEKEKTSELPSFGFTFSSSVFSQLPNDLQEMLGVCKESICMILHIFVCYFSFVFRLFFIYCFFVCLLCVCWLKMQYYLLLSAPSSLQAHPDQSNGSSEGERLSRVRTMCCLTEEGAARGS